jgi:hypothetical protein
MAGDERGGYTARFGRSVPEVVVDAQMWVAL